MKTEIRKAKPQDIPALVDPETRTIGISYRLFLGEAVDRFIESGEVGRFLKENLDSATVVLQDGFVAGLVVATGNFIDLLMVDVDRHRQGLGTLLLEHAEMELFQTHDLLELESFADNAQANAFYRKQGWTEQRRFQDDQQRGRIVWQKLNFPKFNQI